MAPLYGAKLLSPRSRWLQKGVDPQLHPGLTLFPLPLQIEFVTGTKKGTTTNATATTTTTASTAVAGRRQLVCFHRWSEGFPALCGRQSPWRCGGPHGGLDFSFGAWGGLSVAGPLQFPFPEL